MPSWMDRALESLEGNTQSQTANSPTTDCPIHSATLLVGVIRTDTFAGLQGVKVDLAGPSGAMRQTKGDLGTAQFKSLDAGSYEAAFTLSESDANDFESPPTKSIQISEGETKVVLISLTPYANITVKVVTALDQFPIDGACVELIGSTYTQERTIADGTIDFDHIDAGGYSIAVSLSGQAALQYSSPPAKRVTLLPGDNPIYLVEVTEPAELIAKVIRKDNGKAVEGALVKFAGNNSGQLKTNASGIAQFTQVSAGKVRVSLELNEELKESYKGVSALQIELEPGDREQVEFVLDVKLHWIEIELLGEDSKGIPGEVYKLTLSDGTVKEGTLDSGGKARIEDLNPSKCKVEFPNLDSEAWELQVDEQ